MGKKVDSLERGNGTHVEAYACNVQRNLATG